MAVTNQPTRTLHGTRSVLTILGAGGSGACGIFESIETGVSQDHFEPFILGRASAGEVVIMGQAPIMVRLSGLRKMSADGKDTFSPYGNDSVAMNKLQELVGPLGDSKEISVTVFDNQTGTLILQVDHCKVVSHSLSTNAKQPSRGTIELVGLLYSDGTGTQSELGTAY